MNLASSSLVSEYVVLGRGQKGRKTTTIRGRPGPFGLAVTYGAEIEIRPVLPFFRIIETINTSKSGRTCYSMSKVLELQKYQALDFSSRFDGDHLLWSCAHVDAQTRKRIKRWSPFKSGRRRRTFVVVSSPALIIERGMMHWSRYGNFEEEEVVVVVVVVVVVERQKIEKEEETEMACEDNRLQHWH
ncbi:hypothetical protein M0804_000583 [Polistes exclamans]|nr:hypothetical protein M0804_000583 [Polistes exclamans]